MIVEYVEYVKCLDTDGISNFGLTVPITSRLTVNKVYKVYKVVEEDAGRYFIIDDQGKKATYFKRRFTIATEISYKEQEIKKEIGL